MNWMVFASVLLIAALIMNVLALAVYGFCGLILLFVLQMQFC